jgi:hypothetical protein
VHPTNQYLSSLNGQKHYQLLKKNDMYHYGNCVSNDGHLQRIAHFSFKGHCPQMYFALWFRVVPHETYCQTSICHDAFTANGDTVYVSLIEIQETKIAPSETSQFHLVNFLADPVKS